MRKIMLLCTSLVVLAIGVLPSTPARALIFTAYVSNSGSDANNCGLTTPCLTIVHAVTQIQPGGILRCLDDKDYTAFVIITTSIMIDCGGTSAGPFIIDGADITVTIRNVVIFAETGAGIDFKKGAELIVEKCLIYKLAAEGILFEPSTATTSGAPTEISVRNSIIGPNPGAGNVLIKPSNGVAVAASFDNTLMTEGLYGIRADTSGGSGMIRVDVTNSKAKGNTNNGYLAVGTGANPVHFMIDRSTTENNGERLRAE